jgi:hypothetical protein
MQKQMGVRKGIVAALALLILAGAASAAQAGDIMMWRPTTAAGGAPVDPSFWNTQATYQLTGAGLVNQNITLAPSTSFSYPTYYDYSTPTTNVTGGQTVVNTTASMGSGSTLTLSTTHN